jgi:hypothetical protein
MELKKTQIEVLKALAKNRDKRMGIQDIKNACTVKNTNHIMSAVEFFMQNDLVYQPDIDGKIQISGDGLSIANDL